MSLSAINMRKLLLIFGLISFAAFVIYLAYYLITHGRLVLKFNDNELYLVQVVNESTGEVVATDSVRDGEFSKRLSSGGHEVRVTSENDKKAVTYSLKVPRFFGAISTDVNVVNQSTRQKIGRGVGSCPVFSNKQLYSYSCGGGENLVLHKPLSINNFSIASPIAAFEGTKIISAQNYQNGLLALVTYEDGPNAVLIKIDQQGKSSSVILSDNFVSELKNFSLAVDSSSNGSFAVTRDNNKEVLVFSSFDAAPKSIQPDFKIDSSSARGGIDMHNGMIALRYGVSGEPTDTGLEAKEQAENNETEVHIYKASGDKVLSRKLDHSSNDISYCADTYLCVRDLESLIIYSVNGDKLNKLNVLNSVESSVKLSQSEFAYLQNNRIMAMNPGNKSSRLLYYNDRFTISNIHESSNGLLMDAFLRGDATAGRNHLFIISGEIADNNRFVDEILPYSKGSLSAVRDMDYRGNIIFVSVILDSLTSNHQSGNFSYNPKEFNSKRQSVLRQLSIDGFKSPEYRIIISP